MIEWIETVLDKMVRPALAEHGGDVRVIDYADGILQIGLLGQCSTCPAANLTTELLIMEEVKSAIPEVKNVVLRQSASEDMLEMARKILGRTL